MVFGASLMENRSGQAPPTPAGDRHDRARIGGYEKGKPWMDGGKLNALNIEKLEKLV
jgi:hypothetical protein